MEAAVNIAENLQIVREKIHHAARRSGRTGSDIKLIAVTKTVDIDRIRQAIDAGISDIGENRIQEAVNKHPELPDTVTWHLIGHLQRNKVRYALPIFRLVHSLDSIRLAKELHHRAELLDKDVECLVQVNVSGEESKYGIAPSELESFLVSLDAFSRLRIRGLMTVAPYGEPEDARPAFAGLRELAEKTGRLSLPRTTMDYLSMGMSNDFEVAIEEGANLVRIGSAIFGNRG